MPSERPYQNPEGVVDKSQEMPVVPEEEVKIPSESEHKRLIRLLWMICVSSGGAVFVTFGGIVFALFRQGYDTKKIVEVSTAVFQVLSTTAGVGFFIPLGLTSIVTLLLGIRMSRRSVAVLDKLDKAIESRLVRVDKLLLKMEGFVGGMEKGEVPPALRAMFDEAKKFISAELKALREDMRGARAGAETELADALAEGEAAAAALKPSCGLCGHPMSPVTKDEAHTGKFACENPVCPT